MTDLVAGTGLLHFASLVSSLGGNPDEFLRAHGVDPSAAGVADRLISYGAMATVIGTAAVELNCPDFGMRLAKRQGIQILGPVAVLIRHAETVADAIEGVSHYLYHCAPPDVAELKRGPRSSVFTFEIALRQLSYRNQMIEKGLVVAMEAFRLMLGEDFVPLRVTMKHHPLSVPETYREVFGCRVEFASVCNSIHIPSNALNREIRGRDPTVLALAENYLAQIGQMLPLVEHVRELIHRMLQVDQADLVSVARALIIHPRVLQRRLAESDTSFEQILDDVRREMAWQLSTRGLQVAQIASMLGYSEQSSYSRACRRWYGESPRQLITRRHKSP
ncbi:MULTISPECIES: AraC family transcriptional regulator [Pseudomonas]|uniref:HTH-type transcriptional regulator VirS n=1 Tax=Pseudomonas frederiksbergensis TaxID=104087 RepID=A0A6L5C5Y1_9PSED|nr:MULTISPECIES: AraC family transcriptional regulator [Pseudomonas]KAA8553997.1 HTH-type transcriptional regulator VirS [Pseudomonas marginalis]KAF2394857.1 HTH-type transcriptional regulator VirS [Pseudomonas frederiksbergensis]